MASVMILPLYKSKSSLNWSASDFEIPLKEYRDILGLSFNFILKKRLLPCTFSLKITTSLNNPWSHNFEIALDILSLGIAIFSPLCKPDFWMTTSWSKKETPSIEIPARIYSLGVNL